MEFKDRIAAEGCAGIKLITRLDENGNKVESFNALIVHNDGALETEQGTEITARLFQEIYDVASKEYTLPSASRNVLGGIKVYKDSYGHWHINTK